MKSSEVSEAKSRVLDAAEHLFHTRGFKDITLRDIAHMLGLNHASLYHHAPEGKEALYVEVMTRSFAKHKAGLGDAISREASLFAQLHVAACYMLSQPPINFTHMMQVDMPAISVDAAARLSKAAYETFMLPLEQTFTNAHLAGQIRMVSDPRILAGAFLAIVQGVHALPESVTAPPLHVRAKMIDEMIDVMLNGLRK